MARRKSQETEAAPAQSELPFSFPEAPQRPKKKAPPRSLSPKRQKRLEDSAKEIRARPAREDDSLAFMARALVQATLPHSDPGDVRAWGRENGYYSLTIEPGYILRNRQPVSLGLPYGSIPRLLMFWVTTEAVQIGRAHV